MCSHCSYGLNEVQIEELSGILAIIGSAYVNGSIIEFGASAYKLTQSGVSYINGGNDIIGTASPYYLLDFAGDVRTSEGGVLVLVLPMLA